MMIRLRVRRFCRIGWLSAQGILVCFCAPGLLTVGYGQTDPVRQLIARLKAADPDVRQRAAEALGNTKDRRAVEPLIATLKDPFSNVRRSAVDALGDIKDPRAVEPLIAVLRDSYEDREVQGRAASALLKIKDPRAVEPLIAAIDVTNLRELEALKEIGAPAVEGLIAALKDPKSSLHDRAVTVLREIKDPARSSP